MDKITSSDINGKLYLESGLHFTDLKEKSRFYPKMHIQGGSKIRHRKHFLKKANFGHIRCKKKPKKRRNLALRPM